MQEYEYSSLVLLVVVDLIVPAVALVISPDFSFTRSLRDLQSGLVAVTPEEVLGADVLVRVLGALLERREVRPVLPMLIPKVVGVDRGQSESGDDGAVGSVSIRLSSFLPVFLSGSAEPRASSNPPLIHTVFWRTR